jgi:hypothetical protein
MATRVYPGIESYTRIKPGTSFIGIVHSSGKTILSFKIKLYATK